MYYVLIEITHFQQLSRLKPALVREVREQIAHFADNRGGQFTKEQNGQFLLAFHSKREKALPLVSDFMALVTESLQKRARDLFGFSVLLEEDDSEETLPVFQKLKGLLFLAPRENGLWAGPAAARSAAGALVLREETDLWEILGPHPEMASGKKDFRTLLELSGWTEALKTPLENLFTTVHESGRILRLKCQHPIDKALYLRQALSSLYEDHADFPVIFPLDDSQDFLSQLLTHVDPRALAQTMDLLTGPDRELWEANPQLGLILGSQGGSDYPGDCPRDDAALALGLYFKAQSERMKAAGLPPVFVILTPAAFEKTAHHLLEEILTPLVAERRLFLVILENASRKGEFLNALSSVNWSFPPLNWPRTEMALQRLSLAPPEEPGEDLIKACQDRGSALAHFYASRQECENPPSVKAEGGPSWGFLNSFDISHRKIYYVFLMGQSLITKRKLIEFFQYIGEDPAIIQDKLERLEFWGFVLFGLKNLGLRPDFKELLKIQLKDEGALLGRKLAEFLFHDWQKGERRLSEVLYKLLWAEGLPQKSVQVLVHYITHKINRGQGDFLPLLRQRHWETPVVSDETRAELLLLCAAFKLRFALNQPGRSWEKKHLEKFRKTFPGSIKEGAAGEWLLQTGRFLINLRELNEGFPLLKKAFIHAQERGEGLLEIRCGTEIGLALLMKHRIDEAREYFEMSSKNAEKGRFLFNHLVNLSLEAVSRFLWGSLASAAKLLENAKDDFLRSGLQGWRVHALFVSGRIAFETGQYSKAGAYWDGSAEIAARYRFSEAEAVSLRWKARSMAYLRKTPEALRRLEALEPSPEGLFFQAECLAMEGRTEAAIERLEKARAAKWEITAYTGERIPWYSGFAGLEDRLLLTGESKGVLGNLIQAMLGFLQSLQAPSPAILEQFQTLLSQKQLMELDPHAHLYYFWYYKALPEKEEESDALRSTILGRGLKALQTRASRIDDPALRVAYVQEPYWNAHLISEARKQKLL